MKKAVIAFCTFLLIAVSGQAFAAGHSKGTVTAIDREGSTIEIDGKRYYCLKSTMRFIKKGDKVEYVIDNQYDDAKHRTAIVEIESEE